MPDHDIIAVELVGGPWDGHRLVTAHVSRLQCPAPVHPLIQPLPQFWIWYDRTDELTAEGRVIYRYVGA